VLHSGRFKTLPANIRLGWKGLPPTNLAVTKIQKLRKKVLTSALVILQRLLTPLIGILCRARFRQ